MLNILVTGSNSFLGKSLLLNHNLIRKNHTELDITNFGQLQRFFSTNKIDIVIHTATTGGKRSRVDSEKDFYDNIIMLENLLFFKTEYRKLFVFSSGAEFNRAGDINNVKEYQFTSVPVDFYGLSKYINSHRILNEPKVINLRLFNCFGFYEDANRFIKSSLIKYINRNAIGVMQNKYFDFFGINDLIKVIEHFIVNNVEENNNTFNCCYSEKQTLVEVANKINNLAPYKLPITLEEKTIGKCYTGDNERLLKLGLQLNGFDSELNTMYQKLLTK